MPFLLPDYEAIKTAILRDIVNLLPDAAVGADSDYNVRASALASAAEGLYQHQAWAVRQVFPDTADTDYLERHCSLRGIARKPAVAAAGTVLFSGTPAAAVPIGTQARTLDGQVYVTTAAGVIAGGGTVPLAAVAVVMGAAGNQPASTPCTLTSAPAGVLSDALIQTMTNGVDIESDAQMLARLLDLLRSPAAGGNAADYKRWALEVAGITAAFVFSLRRGNGTVDVAVLSNGAAPSGPKIAEVQAYIDARRPVALQGSAVLVAAPTFITVAVTAALSLSGTTLGVATDLITKGLTAYFSTLTPGTPVYRSRIAAIISDTPGVVDFTLSAPAGNTAVLVDSTHLEMGQLGAITLT
jgi:uncharacterized phage protein gp47/JayE